MSRNERSTLYRLGKQTQLFDGALNVWYLPYDPVIQQIIYRQIKAERAGGEDEYEPLEDEVRVLKSEKPTKANLAKIDKLAKSINKIRSRYGNSWLSSFVVLDSCVIDVELVDENNLDAMTADCYWQERKGDDPIGNFDLFTRILSEKTINKLWNGYKDTRTKLPPAPKETQEDAPPKDNPLERNGSQPKKAKRGKKATQPTS